MVDVPSSLKALEAKDKRERIILDEATVMYRPKSGLRQYEVEVKVQLHH